MKRQTTLLIYTAAALTAIAASPAFTVDASHPAGKISPKLYGLMTEEINHSYDGGIYAELIQNRAFLDNAKNAVHWSVVNDNDSAAMIALDPTNSFNDKLTMSLRLTLGRAAKKHPAGVANSGYWGIPVLPKTQYRAAIIARADSNFSGPVTVSVVSEDGRIVFATGKFSGLTTEWKEFKLTLKTGRVTPTAKAHFVITLARFSITFPADVERPSERPAQGPHANAGGLESEIPALPRRQLCRRRHGRDTIRMEENNRPD